MVNPFCSLSPCTGESNRASSNCSESYKTFAKPRSSSEIIELYCWHFACFVSVLGSLKAIRQLLLPDRIGSYDACSSLSQSAPYRDGDLAAIFEPLFRAIIF